MTPSSLYSSLNDTSRAALFAVLLACEAIAFDLFRFDLTAHLYVLPAAFRIAAMVVENASLRNYVSLNLNTVWHAYL